MSNIWIVIGASDNKIGKEVEGITITTDELIKERTFSNYLFYKKL